MINNSDKKTHINEKSAYATMEQGDKPHENNKIATRPEDATNDDFICFHMRDGSSIASSGGVTVIGKKLK